MKTGLHLLIGFTALFAAGAGLASAAALYVNHRTATTSDAIIRKLQAQERSLGELSSQLSELTRARPFEARLNGTSPPVALAPAQSDPNGVDNVEKMAAAVADRVAERNQPEALPRTNENVDAFDQGARLIEAAAKSGRWSEQEFTFMHELVAKLHPEDVAELSHRLAVEINAGRIKPQLRSGLF